MGGHKGSCPATTQHLEICVRRGKADVLPAAFGLGPAKGRQDGGGGPAFWLVPSARFSSHLLLLCAKSPLFDARGGRRCCLFKITSVQRNAASKPAEPQIHTSAASAGSAWFNPGPQPCRRSPEPPEAPVVARTWKGRSTTPLPASGGPAAGPASPRPDTGHLLAQRLSYGLAPRPGFPERASVLSPCPPFRPY